MMSTGEMSYAEKKQQHFGNINEKKDVINFLDIHSLAEIFLLLPVPDRMAVREVCQKWKEACKLAWYNIEKYRCGRTVGLTYNNQLPTQSYVEELLLLCGIYLTELSLSKICNSSIMLIIGEHCKNLTKLEFVFNQRLKVNTDDYIQAFKKLDKLKFIKIKATPLKNYEKTNLEYKILDNLPEEINEIHLIHPRVMSETPVFFNLKKYKNLHSLTLSGCNLDNIIQQISEQIPLVYLDLKNSSVTYKCKYHDFFLFNQLVNLEHFHCANNWKKISSHAPISIFFACKNIRYANGLTGDKGTIVIPKWLNLENLEDLTISLKLNDLYTALQIVEKCKNLKYLHMEQRTEKFFLEKLAELKSLERLVYPLWKIDVESLNTIVTSCKKLKHLSTCTVDDDYDDDDDNVDVGDDDDNNDITDDSDDDIDDSVSSPDVFDEISKLEYLEYLNLTYVDNFQDSSLIAIANELKNLEYLNISWCTSITEAGLDAITRIKSLRRLNVSALQCVTDSFIGKLEGLTFLVCDECKKITDVGLIQFIKNCPDLKHLYLRDTCMTIDTIIAADQTTKLRENNIVLHMHGCREELKTACRSKIRSKWLFISDKKKTLLCNELYLINYMQCIY